VHAAHAWCGLVVGRSMGLLPDTTAAIKCVDIATGFFSSDDSIVLKYYKHACYLRRKLQNTRMLLREHASV
jgi:hypothetical protein